MHYELCILHKSGLPVSSLVELETYGIVGANAQTIETSHTSRIIYHSTSHFHTLRFAHFLTFHTIDAFVGIDLNVIERDRLKAS